jgi:hypothetical protein
VRDPVELVPANLLGTVAVCLCPELRGAGVTTRIGEYVLVDVGEDQLAPRGLRLHRIIDPESTPPDAFFTALELLQRLVGANLPRMPLDA